MRKRDEKLNKITGSRIEECRKACDMTRREVEETDGISEKYLYLLEKGERTLTADYAIRLGKVFKVYPEYLLNQTDYKDSFDHFEATIGRADSLSDLVEEFLSEYLQLQGYYKKAKVLSVGGGRLAVNADFDLGNQTLVEQLQPAYNLSLDISDALKRMDKNKKANQIGTVKLTKRKKYPKIKKENIEIAYEVFSKRRIDNDTFLDMGNPMIDEDDIAINGEIQMRITQQLLDIIPLLFKWEREKIIGFSEPQFYRDALEQYCTKGE